MDSPQARVPSPILVLMSVTASEIKHSGTPTLERKRGGLFLWAPLALLSIVAMRLVVVASAPISDPDAWWHLRVGHQYWSGEWTLTDTGSLSTFATKEWVPRDWIPQLAASKFEDWFGLPGVAWLYGASMLVFLVVAYLTCRRQADPLPATLATVLATLAAGGSLSQRPQMISFILMLVFVGAWLETIRDGKARWWLVPLTWVWACSHGMWYCGIAVGIAVVVGLLMDRQLTRAELAKIAAIPALSFVAAAVTPVGPRLLFSAFETTGMWKYVTEWAPPSFREVGPAVALLMIFLVVVTWGRGTARIPWSHIGLLAVAVAWTVMSARTVALGAVVLAPLVAAVLHGWIRAGRSQRTGRTEIGFLALLVGACLAALALAAPNTAADPGKVPTGLDDELAALPAGSSIINEYTLGGWLHWGHPELQPVIDGFTDGYGESALIAYGGAISVQRGWEDYVAESGARSALLPVDSPLATALEERLNWTVVGTDNGFVLLQAM